MLFAQQHYPVPETEHQQLKLSRNHEVWILIFRLQHLM